VTGGSKGIGSRSRRGAGGGGRAVAIVARARETLEAAAWEIGARAGAEVHAIAADLSVLDGVTRAIEEAQRRLGQIDILVNNAGSIRAGDFLATADEQWTADWNLKLFGYIRMARAVFPIMQAQGGGRIINVIGAAPVTRARPTSPAAPPTPRSSTSRRGLADLGARSNILVTAVSPAATRTERWDSMLANQAAVTGGRWPRCAPSRRAPTRSADRPAEGRRRRRVLPCLRAGQLSDRIGITIDGGSTRGVYP